MYFLRRFTGGQVTFGFGPRARGMRRMAVGIWLQAGLIAWACGPLPARADAPGTSPRGMTGGLVIPTATVLPEQAFSINAGTYREPRFGERAYERNVTFGMGLLRNLEVFARFADYTDTPSGTYLRRGPRDLSTNFKVRLPYLPERGPQAAFGMTDLAGGNVLFASWYGVVSQEWRGFLASAGYVRRTGDQKASGDWFGGLEWRHAPTGLAVLAEHDGTQVHAGGRWFSPPLYGFGALQVGVTGQRSFGAVFPDGTDADDLRGALHLHWALGRAESHRAAFGRRAAARRAATNSVLPPPAAADSGEVLGRVARTRVRPDDLAGVRAALEAAGLERVRVGLQGDTAHPDLVVEVENHRYARNDADALGIALGVASEQAPPAVRAVRVILLQDGLAQHETRVSAAAWRAFLRGAPAGTVRDSLHWRAGGRPLRRASADDVRWERAQRGRATRVRVLVRPRLNQTLGTEFGAFDYALAVEPTVVMPLWTGARLTAAYTIPVHHTPNMDMVGVFQDLRHREELRTVSVGQGLWWGDRVSAHVALGRFHGTAWGTQSELRVFVPGTSDIVRARGVAYVQEPGGLEGGSRAGAVSYRRMWGPVTWTELGWQLFSDGTAGPTLEWTRWAGDVGVTFFGRQGGEDRFVGMTLRVPLTPRRGMAPHAVTVAGPPRHAQGVRTMIDSENGTNHVQPTWVRELVLETGLDEAFSGGRIHEAYLRSHVERLREAFYRYAPEL